MPEETLSDQSAGGGNVLTPRQLAKVAMVAETSGIDEQLISSGLETRLAGQPDETKRVTEDIPLFYAALKAAKGNDRGFYFVGDQQVNMYDSSHVAESVLFADVRGTYHYVDDGQAKHEPTDKLYMRRGAYQPDSSEPAEVKLESTFNAGDIPSNAVFVPEYSTVNLVVPADNLPLDAHGRNRLAVLPPGYLDKPNLELLAPTIEAEFTILQGSIGAGEFGDPADCTARFTQILEALGLADNPHLAMTLAYRTKIQALESAEAAFSHDQSVYDTASPDMKLHMLPTLNGSFVRAMEQTFVPAGAEPNSPPAVWGDETTFLPSGCQLHVTVSDDSHTVDPDLRHHYTSFTYIDQQDMQHSLTFVEAPYMQPAIQQEAAPSAGGDRLEVTNYSYREMPYGFAGVRAK